MKKFLLFLLFAGIVTISAFAQQQWVKFSGPASGSPEMSLLTSNAQEVTFTVSLSGIYTLDTVVNRTAFKRLIIPGAHAINPAGEPELPLLTYRVAIPNCDDVEIAYQVNSTQSMPSCWVYPMPKMVLDGNGMFVEQFTFNPTAYAKPCSPEPAATISSSGAFRMQRYVEVTFSPIEFCPVTKQLSVIDQIEITLTFINPKGDLRQNTGIFNKVAASTFINYEDNGVSALVNDKAYNRTGFTPGTVRWITLTDTAQAATIPGDYLIITVPEFFKPNDPNSQLKRLAEHRAHYNGFDVSIVNVDNILGLNFAYEGNPNEPGESWDKYKREQKLRTFVRRVFEGKNAHNSHSPYVDGHLAYVLLVGDNYNNNSAGMPTSFDHDAKLNNKYASDYYFSCITKTGLEYDEVGDLFIGRFSVQDTTHLYNMVQKTIHHETLYSVQPWRKTAGVTYGNELTPFGDPYRTNYLNYLNLLFSEKGWNGHVVSNEPIRKPTLNYLNSGVVYAHYLGGPYISFDPTGWEDGLIEDTLALRLNNEYRTPFISSFYCHTSHFDGCDGFGEYFTRYSPTKGAVGYIGVSRSIGIGHSGIVDTNKLKNEQELLPYYLFRKNTSIAGELLQITKDLCNSGYLHVKWVRHGYNLLGDPALNIFAENLDMTGNVTLDCKTVLSSTVNVLNGTTMTILCDVYCKPDANIIVESGGKLIIDGGTITNATAGQMWQGITILNGGIVELKKDGKIENAVCGINVQGGGIVEATNAQFVNNTVQVKFAALASGQSGRSGTFTNTNFTINSNYIGNIANFEGHLKMVGCGDVQLSGCTFTIPASANINNGIIINNAHAKWLGNNQLLSVPVVIQSKAIFTNSSSIRSDENTKISVQSGGKLVVDGGTFSNYNSKKLWQGITVSGTAQSQGMVRVINNGKIENAHCGIRVNANGTVYADNANFVNNTTGVFFYPNANGGIFNQTNFELNDAYPGETCTGCYGDTRDFQYHLRIHSGGSISVQGCSFLNIAQNASVRGTGIYTLDSDLEIKEYCPFGCSSTSYCMGCPIICNEKCRVQSSFKGFSTAIIACNSGVLPILKIRFGNFVDNYKETAIFSAHNYLELIKNNFYLSHHNSYGFFLESSTGYKIEENIFEVKNPVSVKTTFGSVINNSGAPENEIYKNKYDGLTKAQLFTGKNSNHVFKSGNDSGNELQNQPTNTGLQTLCNEFKNSLLQDILAQSYSNSAVSIRNNQGSMLSPAGNWFYDNRPSNIDITNSQLNINYYYDMNEPYAFPNNVSSNVTLIPTWASNCCPSKAFTNGGGQPTKEGSEWNINEALAHYDKLNKEYENWLKQLMTIKEEKGEEYDRILEQVSYYSALKDNYFNELIHAVIGNYELGITNYELEEGGDLPEGRGSLNETLRFLFSYRGQYHDYLSMVETYLAENNYRMALATISSMYAKFNLSDYGKFELEGLQAYVQWRQQLYNTGQTIYELPQSEINYLVNFRKSNVGRGVVFANNILCFIYNICLDEDEMMRGLDDVMINDEVLNQSKSAQSVLSESQNSALESVMLVPNPTTGEIQVTSYELKIKGIKIFDVYGRKVSSHNIFPLTTNYKIDISHLQAGIYFVNVNTETGYVVKKVVKQ